LADGHGGEGVGFEGDAVVDGGGGDLGDAADDLLLAARECPAEDVDVAGDAARAELGEQESALEDEVLLAEWVDADAAAVSEPEGGTHYADSSAWATGAWGSVGAAAVLALPGMRGTG
jgi:hypothetical protein